MFGPLLSFDSENHGRQYPHCLTIPPGATQGLQVTFPLAAGFGGSPTSVLKAL